MQTLTQTPLSGEATGWWPNPEVPTPVALPTLAYADTVGDQIDPEQAVRVVRPTFLGWPTLLKLVPIQLFMTVWAGGFCGGMLQALARATHNRLPFPSPFLACAAMAFFGIPIFVYVNARLSHARTEYRLYAGRMESISGAMNVKRQAVDYRAVIRVDLTRGLCQRHYGLGTIKLVTGITPAAGKQPAAEVGLTMADVPDSDELYRVAQGLVSRARGTPTPSHRAGRQSGRFT